MPASTRHSVTSSRAPPPPLAYSSGSVSTTAAAGRARSSTPAQAAGLDPASLAAEIEGVEAGREADWPSTGARSARRAHRQHPSRLPARRDAAALGAGRQGRARPWRPSRRADRGTCPGRRAVGRSRAAPRQGGAGAVPRHPGGDRRAPGVPVRVNRQPDPHDDDGARPRRRAAQRLFEQPPAATRCRATAAPATGRSTTGLLRSSTTRTCTSTRRTTCCSLPPWRNGTDASRRLQRCPS